VLTDAGAEWVSDLKFLRSVSGEETRITHLTPLFIFVPSSDPFWRFMLSREENGSRRKKGGSPVQPRKQLNSGCDCPKNLVYNGFSASMLHFASGLKAKAFHSEGTRVLCGTQAWKLRTTQNLTNESEIVTLQLLKGKRLSGRTKKRG
jgi:hypothetical protein